MSRSRKKSQVFGNASPSSEKPGKRCSSRATRSKVRQLLNLWTDFDEVIIPINREVFNTWDLGKDGKHWRRCPSQKDMRK